MRTKPATYCDVCEREIRKGHLKRARRVKATWQDWKYDDVIEIEDVCADCWQIMVRAARDHREALAGEDTT